MDGVGNADGFLEISIGTITKKTKTIDDNENPEWKELVEMGPCVLEDKVEVKLLDYDPGFGKGRHDVVGVCTLTVSDLLKRFPGKPLHLRQPDGTGLVKRTVVGGADKLCEVFVSVAEGCGWEKAYPRLTNPSSSQRVRVIVEKATGVPSKDTFGLSDPYVEIRMGKLKEKTKAINGTKDPVWRQALEFGYHVCF